LRTSSPNTSLKSDEHEIRSSGGIPPLRDGRSSRPSGRNDKSFVVDEVEKPNFGEVKSIQENRLKQKKMDRARYIA